LKKIWKTQYNWFGAGSMKKVRGWLFANPEIERFR